MRLEKERPVTEEQIAQLSTNPSCTLLNRVEYAVFAVVYFLTEVPLLLGVAAKYCWRGVSAGQRADFSGNIW